MELTTAPTMIAAPLSGERAWFAQARFGIFIHFGLYTVHGKGEDHHRDGWDPRDYAAKWMPQFNPIGFDARQWVEMFQAAGARYCVLTSKHGEGFCLWDTDTTDFKVTNTPFGRDIVGELAAACHDAGMRFGVYFATDNWHHANSGEYEQTIDGFCEFTRRQLDELTTRYGRVDVLWFDGSSPLLPMNRLQVMVDDIRGRQPTIVVNDRGVHHNTTGDRSCGDFVTPERFFPSVISPDAPFVEVCDAMGIDSWGRREDNEFWSVPTLISRLSRCASLGANYLLNVEPEASGQIRPECTGRLNQIGRWVCEHHDALFDTRACAVQPAEHYEQGDHPVGVCTRDANRLHVLLDRMTATSQIYLPGVFGEVARICLNGVLIDARVDYLEAGLSIRELPGFIIGTNPVLTIEWASAPIYMPVKSAEPKVARVTPTEPSVLRPTDAELLPSHDGITWHQIERYANGSESIGRWVRASSRARWHIDVEADGVYDVFIYLGTSQPQAEAVLKLEIGQAVLTTRSRETGWYGDAYGYHLGRLELARGRHWITLSAELAKFGPNIHGMVLVTGMTGTLQDSTTITKNVTPRQKMTINQ